MRGITLSYGELEAPTTRASESVGGAPLQRRLAYLSVPVLSFSIPKAGDYIDSSAAGVLGERANRMRLTKEDSFHLNGFFSENSIRSSAFTMTT